MTESNTATVETLTAEVRVLMVGNRQITSGVYKQLDFCPTEEIRPLGRVRSGLQAPGIEVVGADARGQLVRARLERWSCERFHAYEGINHTPECFESRDRYDRWSKLPLIVLAGLR
ncbi:MAG: hypothetical protein U5N53_18495 [Mycobacterium sp.]|nr:hypothetical protein [Mycobacterium sp.]